MAYSFKFGTIKLKKIYSALSLAKIFLLSVQQKSRVKKNFKDLREISRKFDPMWNFTLRFLTTQSF